MIEESQVIVEEGDEPNFVARLLDATAPAASPPGVNSIPEKNGPKQGAQPMVHISQVFGTKYG